MGICDKDAEWHIRFSQRVEDFTRACDDHVVELAKLYDAIGFTVTKLDAN